MASGTASSVVFVTGGPRIQLSVSTPTWTETTVTVSYTLRYLSGSINASDVSRCQFAIEIDGTKVSGGSYTPTGLAGQVVTITSGTTTINRTGGPRIFTAAAVMSFNGTWNDVVGDSRGCSLGLEIQGTGIGDDWTVISYNMNGGYGNIGPTYKSPGVVTQITTSTPTRSGYNFLGWADSPYATQVEYTSGQYYYDDVSVILYAVWEPKTYTITYSANGGSGAPSIQTKQHGSYTFYLSSVEPTRTGYTFKGWGTSSTATSPSYYPGDNFIGNYDLDLYAVWSEVSTDLYISDLAVDRCTSSGVLSETGTYAKITGDYVAANGYDSITIEYRVLGSTGSYTAVGTISVGSTSGVINYRCGGSFSIEENYQFRVTISDAVGNEVSYTATLATMNYVMDFMQGGTGLTIGAAATSQGFNVIWPSTFNDSVTVPQFEASGNVSFTGTTSSFDCSANQYIDLPTDVRMDGTQFLGVQNTSNGRPMLVNHIGLERGFYIQLQNTSGTFNNLLGVNSSNETEFGWTSGGLRGDVRKTLWSGSWRATSSKSITGAQKYNVFIIRYSNSTTTNKACYLIRSFADKTSGYLYGGTVFPGSDGSTAYMAGFTFYFSNRTSSSETWTLYDGCQVGWTSSIFNWTDQTYIYSIEGLI